MAGTRLVLCVVLVMIASFGIQRASSDACGPGTTSLDGVTCTNCSEGQYGYRGICYQCEPGFYAPSSGMDVCFPCPPGSMAPDNGSTTCTPCGQGAFSIGKATNCTTCPAGYYAFGTMEPSCTPCSPGSSTGKQPGASECISCLAGTYSGEYGSPGCAVCDSGTYSTDSAMYCTKCPPGTFSGGNAAECTNCSDYSVATSYASTTCSSCYYGYEGIADSGAGYCLPCSPGAEKPNLDGACTPCQPGTASATTTTMHCPICVGGFFSGSPGATACSACAPGYYSEYEATGQSNCTQCGPGTTSFGSAYYCFYANYASG